MHPIHGLRTIALLEACSYLVLLGIAMPLKYFADQPLAVRYVGWAHGLLFVLFCAALLRAQLAARWPLARSAAYFVASLLPIVPFFLDRGLREHARAYDERARTGSNA